MVCRWFLLLGHVGVAFIERRLSLLILFIIFYYETDNLLSAIYSQNVSYQIVYLNGTNNMNL
jgi:hypothetical protein